MDRFKEGLSPYFTLEANLKDPTTFLLLVQTCQAYNRQIQVLQARADSKVATLKSPLLQQSSIVHEVFHNVFMTNPTTYQLNVPMMQEATRP